MPAAAARLCRILASDTAFDIGNVETDGEYLPSGQSRNLLDSQPSTCRPAKLPTPEEVRKQAKLSGINIKNTIRPAPVRFPDLGILVKWGSDVTITEGQCLWFLHRNLSNKVPVPRIFGWTWDEGQTFLYMELVSADPLLERWDTLSSSDKSSVCEELSGMVEAWRRLRRPRQQASKDSAWTPSEIWRWICRGFEEERTVDTPLLSQIGGAPLRDIMFQDGGQYPAGPYKSLKDFHDSFATLPYRNKNFTGPNPRETTPELDGLSDDVRVVFTHSDLDHSNILISKPNEGPVHIKAIIDWHQAGWYPEHWEWLKTQSVAPFGCEWVSDYLPSILPPAPHEYFRAFEYISMGLIGG